MRIYKNFIFGIYEITVSGTVYRRDKETGSLRRIKGKQATEILKMAMKAMDGGVNEPS